MSLTPRPERLVTVDFRTIMQVGPAPIRCSGCGAEIDTLHAQHCPTMKTDALMDLQLRRAVLDFGRVRTTAELIAGLQRQIKRLEDEA